MDFTQKQPLWSIYGTIELITLPKKRTTLISSSSVPNEFNWNVEIMSSFQLQVPGCRSRSGPSNSLYILGSEVKPEWHSLRGKIVLGVH